MTPPLSPPPSVPGPPPTPALRDFARTQRRAGRSAILGLALLGLVALTSPLLAYREELENAREEALAHLSVQSQVQAEALGAHLQLLEAELQRLAQHPQLVLEDGPSGPEVDRAGQRAAPHPPVLRGRGPAERLGTPRVE